MKSVLAPCLGLGAVEGGREVPIAGYVSLQGNNTHLLSYMVLGSLAQGGREIFPAHLSLSGWYRDSD